MGCFFGFKLPAAGFFLSKNHHENGRNPKAKKGGHEKTQQFMLDFFFGKGQYILLTSTDYPCKVVAAIHLQNGGFPFR